MHTIAIDPGQSGAAVLVDSLGNLVSTYVYDAEDPQNEMKIVQWLRDAPKAHVIIEKVNGSPIQGSGKAFVFGKNFGLWQGLIFGVLGPPLELVHPSVWQNFFAAELQPKRWAAEEACADLPRVKQKGKLKISRKGDLKELAQKLYPGVKVTLKNADALLIAQYAVLRRTQLQQWLP